jgi:hypothetical protein
MSFLDTSADVLSAAGMSGGGAAAGAAGGMAGFAGMLGPLGMASPIISGVASAIGGITSFVSENQQAKQAELAARQASITGGINTQEALLHGMAATGRAATLAAASGGGLGGTTAGVLNQIAERGQFNARAAAYRGATQAETDEYMAKVDKDNAMNSLISGFTGAAGQAVAGGLKQGFREKLLSSKAYQAGEIDPYALSTVN